ncbi:MAG: hypothetical protein K2M03_06515, partial [Muribaculaceae bacterium]|nr:hypothetical protein [Muribaculaceae bacterium]
KEITVKFSVKNGYTAQGVDLSAAVVRIENNVQGNNSGYNQENAFSIRNEAFIVSNYGEWLVPYMRKYLMGGELGLNSIPFSKMVYQHVARGIFPDFYGDKLNTEWVAGEAQNYEWKVKVPNTVMNWENVEAIVLVMKNGLLNGKVLCPIVGSDIMASDKFTSVSGVADVMAENMNIERAGQNIVVTSDTESVVTLYNVEGMVVGRYNLSAGQLAINASDLNGLVIVKVDNANGSLAKKFVF